MGRRGRCCWIYVRRALERSQTAWTIVGRARDVEDISLGERNGFEMAMSMPVSLDRREDELVGRDGPQTHIQPALRGWR